MKTVLVYGGPTTGKSTLIDELVADGIATIDTDMLIESFCSAELGASSSEWEKAWDYWKDQATPEFKDKVTKAVFLLIEKLRFKYPAQPLAIFTNLHHPGLKPDLAYFRDPQETLELMKSRAKSKNREITPSYEQEILGWKVPTVGQTITTLRKEEFISKEAVLAAMDYKLQQQIEQPSKQEMAKAMSFEQ